MITDINDFIRKSESKVEIARQNGRKSYYFMGIEFGENRNLYVNLFIQHFQSAGYVVYDATGKGCKNCGRADIVIEF